MVFWKKDCFFLLDFLLLASACYQSLHFSIDIYQVISCRKVTATFVSDDWLSGVDHIYQETCFQLRNTLWLLCISKIILHEVTENVKLWKSLTFRQLCGHLRGTFLGNFRCPPKNGYLDTGCSRYWVTELLERFTKKVYWTFHTLETFWIFTYFKMFRRNFTYEKVNFFFEPSACLFKMFRISECYEILATFNKTSLNCWISAIFFLCCPFLGSFVTWNSNPP